MTRSQSASYPFGWGQRLHSGGSAWPGRTTLPLCDTVPYSCLTPSSPQPYAILNEVQEVGWKTKGLAGWLSMGLDYFLCHFCLGTQYPLPPPPAGPALLTLSPLSTPLNLAGVQASGFLSLTAQSSVRLSRRTRVRCIYVLARQDTPGLVALLRNCLGPRGTHLHPVL